MDDKDLENKYMSTVRIVRVKKCKANLFGVPNKEEIKIWKKLLFQSRRVWGFQEMRKDTKNTTNFQLIKKVESNPNLAISW